MRDNFALPELALPLQSGLDAWPPEARGVGRGFVAVRGEGVVPFRLRPGPAAVTLGTGEERREERTPEPLRWFLRRFNGKWYANNQSKMF